MIKNYYKLIVALLFATNVFGQNLPSYLPKDGLVGWWPFNGNANDESGNGNHGNSYSTSFAYDRFGTSNRSVYMSGNDLGTPSYIDIPSSASLNSGNKSFTWSFWHRSSAVSNQVGYNLNHAILSKTRAGTTCDGSTIFESKGYWGSQILYWGSLITCF